MFFRCSFFIGILLLCGAMHARAQGVPENVQRRIELEQLRQQQRDWDFNTQSRNRPDIRLEEPTEKDRVAPEYNGPCFAIRETRIEGADDGFPIPDIVNSLNGKCIQLEDLNAYLNEMNAFYSDSGYITTRVYLPEQDLSSGVLLVLIIPGRTSGFGYEGGEDADTRIYSAFPFQTGDVINLRDIEQALENFNSPRSQSGKFKLYPGTEQGTSIVRIAAQNELPFGFNLSRNNFGYSNTGRQKVGVGGYFDNLLNLNDTIQLNASSTSKGIDGGDTYSRSASGSYFVPFGNWSVNIGSGYSEYGFIIPAINQTLPLYGHSYWVSTDIQRLLWRNASSKIYGVGGIEVSRARNFLDDFEVVVQRRYATKTKIGVNGRVNFDQGSYDWAVNAIRGLQAFGAEKPLDPDIDAQPLLFTGSSAIQMALFDGAIRLSHQLNGQYSNDNLASADEFALGGGYFGIRGFRENSLSGASGVSTRNDVSYRFFETEYASADAVLGLDGGYVRLSTDDRQIYDTSFLAGASAGIRLSLLGKIQIDLVVARALERPAAFTDSGVIQYAQASLAF